MQRDFILLDGSGSMHRLWDEALAGINIYAEKLMTEKVDTKITLAIFDADNGNAPLRFDVLRTFVTPDEWTPVTATERMPRGWTPLNDATARMVTMARDSKADKVVMTIMTDGLENASIEYHRNRGGDAMVRAMLDDCRKKEWQIIFLGASFDNVQQATSYGASRGQHVNSSIRNLGATMSWVASGSQNYGVTGQSVQFTPEQQEEAKKE